MDLKTLLLEENVGGYDLMARALAGTLAVIALAVGTYGQQWTLILEVVAFGGLYSALMRHCTPYALFGLNTARSKSGSK